MFIKRSGTKALEVDHGTGDISFYDDTGSSAALFWDASAESLGIGLTNPSEKLEVSGKIKASGQIRAGSYLESFPSFSFANDTDTGMFSDTANQLEFSTGGSSRLVIDSSGNATFAGTISSGAITASASSTIQGNLLLDSASAEINLKSGIGTESGAVNWTFNTTGTNYASIKLPYDTRATTGFHIDSGYPITIDATTRINFAISGTTRYQIEGTSLKAGGQTVLDSGTRNLTNIGTISSGAITSTELTITGGTDSEDIYINNTSPTLGFTDSNSFSDSNDVYLIRGTSTGKLQFQFKDDSAGTTTQ